MLRTTIRLRIIESKIPKTRIQNKKHQKHEYKVKYKNTNTRERPKIRIQYEKKSNLKTNISEINKPKNDEILYPSGG